jgi:hypothetical protein
MRFLRWPTLGIRLQRMELGSIKGVEGFLSRHGALARCTTSLKWPEGSIGAPLWSVYGWIAEGDSVRPNCYA